MISLYTSGSTKPVVFLVCFPFQGVENHIPAQQTHPDLHTALSNAAFATKSLPPVLVVAGRTRGTLVVLLWKKEMRYSEWIPAGSGQSKGLHLRKDKLPCNAPTCTANSCGRSCPDTSPSWAGALGTSVSGWWICAAPNCTGKMRRLPTGCKEPGLASGNVQ